MNKKVKEPINDNRERKTHDDSSQDSISGDSQATSGRSVTEGPGLENTGSMGSQPTSGPESSRTDGFLLLYSMLINQQDMETEALTENQSQGMSEKERLELQGINTSLLISD